MSNDNRVSAKVSDEDALAIRDAVASIRSRLPFLITLSPVERQVMPKLGEKSIGFDEKCVTYMESHPQFIPGFVDLAEVEKDRVLRSQFLRFMADLVSMYNDVSDTLMCVSSEVWMADLAYYHSAREAAKRGRSGAKEIYDDLARRFPGRDTTPAVAAAPTPAPASPATPVAA